MTAPPAVGARYLAPSGRVWHVRSITRRGDRVVLRSESDDGEHGAIMDISAVRRMIPLDPAVEEPADVDARVATVALPTPSGRDDLVGGSLGTGTVTTHQAG